jgi:hypothetical protein
VSLANALMSRLERLSLARAFNCWRKAQERIAALVRPSAIGELADQLDSLGAREQNPA